MNKQELETVVRSLDTRVSRIEQILPTLATKADVADAVRPLATKAELHQLATAVSQLPTRDEMHEAIDGAIRAAVEPLATRAEMHDVIRNEGERTRCHFDAVAERL